MEKQDFVRNRNSLRKLLIIISRSSLEFSLFSPEFDDFFSTCDSIYRIVAIFLNKSMPI